MSDLLPLLTAALRDQCLVDVKEELDGLYKRFETSTSIEIIHDAMCIPEDDDIAVYASGQFENGNFGHGKNVWEVPLKNIKSCKLKDIGKCDICVGGGFTIESFQRDDDRIRDCFLHQMDNGKIGCKVFFGGLPDSLSWYGPPDLMVFFTIEGWPREEWKPLTVVPQGELPMNPEEMIQYIMDTVAKNHPDATAQFEHVTFWARTIQGPLRRVLTKKRKQQAEKEELERRRPEALLEFMVSILKERDEVQLVELYEDRDMRKHVITVREFFVHCNLHNYVPTDEAGIRGKTETIAAYMLFYKRHGRKSLWQQETGLKDHIENLISKEAERSA